MQDLFVPSDGKGRSMLSTCAKRKILVGIDTKQNIDNLTNPFLNTNDNEFKKMEETVFKTMKTNQRIGALHNNDLSTASFKSLKPSLFSKDLLSHYQLSSNQIPLRDKQVLTPGTFASEDKVKDRKKKSKGMKHVQEKRNKEKQTKERKVKIDIDIPAYDMFLPCELKDDLAAYRNKLKSERENIFVDHKDDEEIKRLLREKINEKKIILINMVSIALINAPKIGDVNDRTRQELLKATKMVVDVDPEFVLKVALYTRRILNIRTISTFILAFAAYLPETRPYLKKYFKESIVLPSDWIAVAELYQTFFDGTMTFGALPAALRKVMVEKFQDFDEYQLGKYNKGKTKTKTKTVSLESETVEFLIKEDLMKENMRGVSVDEDEDMIKEYEMKSLSLKQLVRKLHISKPAYYVMCLVGKKYPSTIQEFYQSHLPGNFEEEKCGQKMKLKIPETWETQVSMKGNNAKTWQELIDHKRLPFMAMLRNLRNMIKSGMGEKYHALVIRRLTDEKSVINSKQFPFRFLSAYDVVDEMEKELEPSVQPKMQPFQKGKRRGVVKKKKACFHLDKALLTRYKKALENALRVSTIFNISPIPGNTVIIIDIEEGSAKSILTKSISTVKRSVLDMCLLLGFMCKFHCEDSKLILNDSSLNKYIIVESVDRRKILDNVHQCKEMVEKLWEGQVGTDDLQNLLYRNISKKRKIDNFLIIGGIVHDEYLNKFVRLFRSEVNKTCLAVRVSLLSRQSSANFDGGFDVSVHGFSDQVLRYISERGSGKQLSAVENVDIAFNLEDVKVKSSVKKEVVAVSQPIYRAPVSWKTVRIFISSTFQDMHGERDLLTRYVFPELRCWCYNYCLNIYEVDLRWGITEKQSQSSKQLEICLREALKSDLFVGIIGERFGWVPDSYNVDDTTNLEWLREMPSDCSITELEMRGFLQRDENSARKSIFCFRNKEALNDVPKVFEDRFIAKNAEGSGRLGKLKSYVVNSNTFMKFHYSAQWGGYVEGKPFMKGLEDFGRKVLQGLWSAVKENYLSSENDKDTMEASSEQSADKHIHFANELSKRFVGRSALVQKGLNSVLTESMLKQDKNLLVISGKNGSGKTAYMAELVRRFQEQSKWTFCCYFTEAGPEFVDLRVMLRFLFCKLNNAFNLGFSVPETYRELRVKLENVLKAASKELYDEQCVIFIDGLDQFEGKGNMNVVEWIPEKLPKGIVLVVSCADHKKCYRALLSHPHNIGVIKLGAMDYSERAKLVREVLTQYGKQLEESPFNNQLRLLLSKKDAGSPLYLKLACEELRMFGVYEKLNDYLRRLAQTTPQLTGFILDRIEMEYGKHLLRNIFAILYFTKYGLREDELYESLNLLHNIERTHEQELMNGSRTRCLFSKEIISEQIPRSYYLRMCREVKIFLHEDADTGCISLNHNEVIREVESRYISSSGNKFSRLVHLTIASFLRKQTDPNDDCTWKGKDVNALNYLPSHILRAHEQWGTESVLSSDLRDIVTNGQFIRTKVEAGLTVQLLEDLQLVPCSNEKEKEMIADITEFVSKNVHILTRYPKMFLQLAVNSPNESYMHDVIKEMSEQNDAPLITWLNKPVLFSNCLLTISNIQSEVLCVNVSNDDRMIVCGTNDGIVFVYEKYTGKEINAFYGHSSAVTSCCYAGSDKICSASADGSLAVWDIINGCRLHQLKKHKEAVTGCVTTTDGKFAVSVSLDNTALLWSLTDGKEAGELSDFEHPFNCVALDKDEKHAALGSWDNLIIIWNILENKRVTSYKGHKSSIRSLAYSPNKRYLASSSLDGDVFLWSTQNGAKIGQLSCHSNPVQHLQFTNNGLQLIGASADTSVKVWSGSLGCPESIFKQKDMDDHALTVCASEQVFAVGYNSGIVELYDNKNEKKLFSWKAHSTSVRSICFMKNSRKEWSLLTASDDQLINRWNFSNPKYTPTKVYTLRGHTNGVTCVRARESIVISTSKDSSVRVWNGLYMNDNLDDVNVEETAIGVLHGHTGIVTCCDLSLCESKAISSGYDRVLNIWCVNTLTRLCSIHNSHADSVTTCCWSDVGNYVVTGSNDFTLKLWNTKVMIENKDDVSKLKERVVFTGHSSTVNDVKYKYGCVVSACSDGSVKVWTHNGIEITSLKPHEKRINCCDLWTFIDIDDDLWSSVEPWEQSVQQKVRAMKPKSLTDIYLYIASDDGTVQRWRPFKPNLLSEMYGHSNEVSQITCSSTEQEIVSCSLDETVKLWSVKSFGNDMANYVHRGSVNCIAVWTGSLVASGGDDGRVLLYNNETWKASLQVSRTDSVTSVRFLSATNLVTGCGDGMMAIWDVGKQRVLTQHQFDSSILCIAVKISSKSHIVVSTCTNWEVWVWTEGNCLTKLFAKNVWPQHIFEEKYLQSYTNNLISDDEAELLTDYPVVDVQVVGESDELLFTMLHDYCMFGFLSNMTSELYVFATYRLHNNLISAIKVTGVRKEREQTYLFNGYTDGWLTLDVLGQKKEHITHFTKQVHSSDVTGLLIFNDIIVTASKDSTVKVWRLEADNYEMDMVQIGLFCCRSSVMSLSGFEHQSCVSLAVGDRIGNVEFLTLTL